MAFQLEAVAQAFCAAKGCKLLGGVGEGAFKETYRAEAPDGSQLALKVIRPGFSAARTQREIDAMVRCSHPHIAKLNAVETIQVGGSSYVICLEEFLAGGSLAGRLQAGVLSPQDTVALGNALIDAVAHVASHRLVHRDLKPDNVMFRDGGMSPVVVDFGLVRDLAKQSLTMTWLMRGPGTPMYAPPEQLLNEKALIDWRADQFSLGVVLSFVALGFHPYSEVADTPGDTVDRVASRSGPTQRFVDGTGVAGLESLRRMVAPYPIQRFRTPEKLAAAWPRGV